MKKITVRGAKPLNGEIRVSGSKNAALPIIFASILIPGEVKLSNVPAIGDVLVALDILSYFGADVSFIGDRLSINSKNLKYKSPPRDKISKIRASTYLIGASLARFGKFELSDFGGCNFSARPIDLHIKSAISLGAAFEADTLIAKKLSGTRINIEKRSVGATINTLIMASAAEGETEIYGFAREPHVLSVIDFLSALGADISVADEKITITPAQLRSGEYSIIGDMIEAGTYLAAACITGGTVTAKGFAPRELSSLVSVISSLGYSVSFGSDLITVSGKAKPKSNKQQSVTAAPYPGFPTDLQPIIAPLFAVNNGGEIRDEIFPSRFGYMRELSKFGVKYTPITAGVEIEKSTITPASVTATDLRGGAACVLSALTANGSSEILSPDIILRGYSDLIKKMSALGADIEIE